MDIKEQTHAVNGETVIDISLQNNLTKEELMEIVDIHMQTFTGFFLTFLGRGFLYQLYKGFQNYHAAGLIVAKCEGTIVGFLAYAEDLSAFYKYLIKKQLLAFAWYGFCAFLRKPSTMMRLIRAFFKPGESKREERYIELSSIGVLPQMKNRHIGTRLINALKDKFDNESFAYIKLETDAVENDAANSFYQKNGFVLSCEYETPEGRKMNEYRWK